VIPEQWHVYLVDLEPRVGTKPGKQRPCVAIQPTVFGRAGLQSTVVIPCTTKIVAGDAYPLRVHLPLGSCGLSRPSDVLIDQVLAWDNQLFRDDLGAIPSALSRRLKSALREFLELDA